MKKIYVIAIIIFFYSCTTHQKQELPFYLMKASDSVSRLLTQAELSRCVSVDSSFNLYKKAIATAEALNDDKGILEAYRMAIFTSGVLQNKDSLAIALSNESMPLAHKTGDANALCDAYGMRALVYQANNKLDSAAAVNELALMYMEKDDAPDSHKNWALYNNVSALYRDLGNFKLAIEYTERYKKHLEVIKDSARFINAYNNLYVYYTDAKDTATAGRQIYQAYHLMEALKKQDANVFSNLSMFYNRRSQYDSALYFSKKRLALAYSTADTVSAIRAYIGILETTEKSGDITTATNILPQANGLLTAYHGELPGYDEKELYDAFYKNYQMTGNPSLAFMYMELAKNLGEEMRTQERNKDLEKYELERKKVMQENIVLAKELQINKKNNTILSLIGGGILFISIAGGFMLLFKKRNAVQKKKIEFLQKEKEWEHTRSVLEGRLEERNRISRELHDDLGTSLTSIALAGDIIKNKQGSPIEKELQIISSSAAEMVTTLNEIVWSLNSRNDSLYSTVAYIRKFATSFLAKAGIILEMDESFATDDVELSGRVRRAIYLTAKEAIHNIVKHSGASAVRMNVTLESDTLRINICDNGRGLSQSAGVDTAGNGLGNMRKNMLLAGGTCKISTMAAGVEVEIICKVNVEK